MLRSFVFGCKRLLAEWGYKKRIVYVDTEEMDLKINGQQAISASVNGNLLHVSYHGDFKEWDDFKQNPWINALKSKASAPLNKTVEDEKGSEKGSETEKKL